METSISLLEIIKIYKNYTYIAHLFHLMSIKVFLADEAVIKSDFLIRALPVV